MNNKNTLHSTLALMLALAALWPAASRADRRMDMSSEPDTQTRFTWAGEGQAKNKDKQMLIFVQKGGSMNAINVAGPTDVGFAKADMDQLKWCAIATTEKERDQNKKCKPDKMLKPGGEIRIP